MKIKKFFFVWCTIFSKKKTVKEAKTQKKENYKENVFSQISPQINSFSIVGLYNIHIKVSIAGKEYG